MMSTGIARSVPCVRQKSCVSAVRDPYQGLFFYSGPASPSKLPQLFIPKAWLADKNKIHLKSLSFLQAELSFLFLVWRPLDATGNLNWTFPLGCRGGSSWHSSHDKIANHRLSPACLAKLSYLGLDCFRYGQNAAVSTTISSSCQL